MIPLLRKLIETRTAHARVGFASLLLTLAVLFTFAAIAPAVVHARTTHGSSEVSPDAVTFSTTGVFSGSGTNVITFTNANGTTTLTFNGTTNTVNTPAGGQFGDLVVTTTVPANQTGPTISGTFTLNINQSSPPGTGSFVGTLSGTLGFNTGVATLTFGTTSVDIAGFTYTINPVYTIALPSSGTGGTTATGTTTIQGTVTGSAGQTADLLVNMTDNPDPVVAGGNLTYSLTVSNAGPFGATGVTVSLNLPASVLFVSATPSQGSCSLSGSTVNCTLGNIANAANATISIVVKPQSSGTITSNVSVTAAQVDPAPGNNSASEQTTVLSGTDLALAYFSPPPTTMGTGGNAEAQLQYRVQNLGPLPATGVQVVITAPAGTSISNAGGSFFSCTVSGGTVATCTYTPSPLNVGQSTINALNVFIRASNPGAISVTATATSSIADPNSSNNTLTTNLTVRPTAQLFMASGDATPNPVLLGNNTQITVYAFNFGPQDSTNPTITATIPAGLSFVSGGGAGWTCSAAGSNLTCVRSNGILPGDSNVYAPLLTFTGTAAGSYAMTFTLNPGPELDPFPTQNHQVTMTINVQPTGSDLSLEKIGPTGNATVGGVVNYTLRVRNNGPNTVNGTVTVTDTLPAQITFISASGPGWSCSRSGSTVTCTISGVFGIGYLPDITISISPRNGAIGSMVNTACAAVSNPADNVPGNNCGTATTTVVASSADVSITASVSPSSGNTGQFFTYTYTITNAGPGQASTVAFATEVHRDNANIINTTQGSCSIESIYPEGPRHITCDLGNMASGTSATITLQQRTFLTGTVINTATISSPTGDPNFANNSASTNYSSTAGADMQLQVVHSPVSPTAGTPLTYTLTVFNGGWSATTGTVVTHNLPAGVVFLSATPSAGSCSQAGGVVTCNLGNSSIFSTVTIGITVRPTIAGVLTTTSSVSSGLFDYNPSNNNVTYNVNVAPADVDLVLNLTDTPDPVAQFSSVSYSLTVTNARSSQATGITLTTNLPAGFSFQSASISRGSCLHNSGVVTCSISHIDFNETITATINMLSGAPGVYNGNASVTLTEADFDSSNNSDTETTTVRIGSDLSVSLSDSPDPVPIGGNVTYTASVTNSPSSAPDAAVVLTMTLPAGTTFVSATPAQGSCSQAVNVVTCNLGSVGPALTVPVTIVVTTTAPGTITASASVSGVEPDPNSANNSASTQTVVAGSPALVLTKDVTPVGAQPPNTDLTFNISFANNGALAATSVVITDPVPSFTDFKVGSAAANLGSSGLVLTLLFSNDGGSTYTYTPTSGGGGAPPGYDRAVTNIRWSFAGSLSNATPNNTGSVTFMVRIR